MKTSRPRSFSTLLPLFNTFPMTSQCKQSLQGSNNTYQHSCFNNECFKHLAPCFLQPSTLFSLRPVCTIRLKTSLRFTDRSVSPTAFAGINFTPSCSPVTLFICLLFSELSNHQSPRPFAHLFLIIPHFSCPELPELVACLMDNGPGGTISAILGSAILGSATLSHSVTQWLLCRHTRLTC